MKWLDDAGGTSYGAWEYFNASGQLIIIQHLERSTTGWTDIYPAKCEVPPQFRQHYTGFEHGYRALNAIPQNLSGMAFYNISSGGQVTC